MPKIGTYAMVNAKVRAMRSDLISPNTFQNMMDARNLHDLISRLSHTRLEDVIKQVKEDDPVALEKVLFQSEISELLKIKKYSKGTPDVLIDIFLQRYEGERLKAILRSWHGKEELDPIYYTKIRDTLQVDALLSTQTIEEFLYQLNESQFRKPLEAHFQTYKDRKTLFPLELAIDKYVFQQLFDCLKTFDRNDRAIAKRLVGVEIDIKNLDWIGRYRRYYKLSSAEIANLLLPNGYRIGSSQIQEIMAGKDLFQAIMGLPGLSALSIDKSQDESLAFEAMEQFLYKLLYQEAGHAFGQFPFSIGAILGYYYLLKIESKNIKTLLYAKAYGIAESQIQELVIL